MQKKHLRYCWQLLLLVILLLFLSTTANAAIAGFVTRDEEGTYYQYCYEKLLDSYALKILDQPNGFYENYAKYEVFALVDCRGKYIDYEEILDLYAEAVIHGKNFDLAGYMQDKQVKRARMPDTVQVVELIEGNLVYNFKTISSNKLEPGPDFKPPKIETPLIGAAGVSLKQAQKWAEERDAHQRLIDIAPLYWSYSLKTGIRPEVLFAQAAVETDFGHYSGQLSSDYHNWAGILRADAGEAGPEDYEKFASPEEGIRGHFNHIAAYLGLKPLGEPHDRYEIVLKQPWAGSVLNVDQLSGKWAPADDYHILILFLLDQIKNTKLSGDTTGDNSDDATANPDHDSDSNNFKHVVVDVADITVLHLRSGPSTDHDIIDRLIRGTILEVNDKQGKWLGVITPGDKNGWVHGDYVRAVDLSKNPFKDRVIVIDPGHGGSDPGATGVTGLKEKLVNLAVAEILEDLLKEAGARVIMTRSGDYYVSNRKRVELANVENADAFVSIHANAYSNHNSNGTETYFCSVKNNSDAGRYLAQQLQRELVSELGLRDRGVKTNSFYVLNKTEMPSALVELGFLSNPEEEELLRNRNTHVGAANALFKGLEAYFRKYR